MISNNTQDKIWNFILAGLVVVGVFVLVSLGFDFYYDLNDDMAIKDIVSGAYSGSPSGYTNQMLYPLGWLLSLVYQLLPKAPVFGIFLCGCFGLSFYLITYRIQSFFQDRRVKLAVTVLMLLVFPALMLWELVYVQYSVACGVLAGTACFWFCTNPVDCEKGEFWRSNIPALFLVWLAFLIRSEMMLLTLPFVATVGIWHLVEATKLARESSTEIGQVKITKYLFSKDNIIKYVVFVVIMFLGMGLLLGLDSLAYRDSEWQNYRGFFDARTKVYDYTWYPDYEEQQAFYEEQGISEVQYTLIDNYNFGLDESIDEKMLISIASFDERAKHMGSFGYRIKNAVLEVGKRMFLPQYGPYNYFVVAGYALLIGLAYLQKEKSYVWKILLLLAMRMIPWMYLALAGRVVDRIAHPLYIIEFFLLLAMLVQQLYDRPLWNPEKYYRIACGALLVLISILSLPLTIGKVNIEQKRREAVTINQDMFDDYAKANTENYYYLDVYSTVSFVEKMFEDVDNSRKNYDLLGGWVFHSPLQEEATRAYVSYGIGETVTKQEAGEVSIADRLLWDNFYFVIAANRDAKFLEDLYQDKGKNVVLEVIDTVGEGDNPFLVYKVVEQTKPKKTMIKR